MAAVLHYHHKKYEDVSEIQWRPSNPVESGNWFKTLVLDQQPSIPGDSRYYKYFGVAEEVHSAFHTGFCFAYASGESDEAEIAGVYVAEAGRHSGAAIILMEKAISVLYRLLDRRKFNLRFISETARTNGLQSKFRDSVALKFPDAVFNLYFPEHPRHVKIGA